MNHQEAWGALILRFPDGRELSSGFDPQMLVWLEQEAARRQDVEHTLGNTGAVVTAADEAAVLLSGAIAVRRHERGK